MSDANLKIPSGLHLILYITFKTVSIISVNKTLRHKYKQIKITLKQFLIFFSGKNKNVIEPAP